MQTTSTSATVEPHGKAKSTRPAEAPRSHDLAAAASVIAFAIALAFLIVLAIVTGGEAARDRHKAGSPGWFTEGEDVTLWAGVPPRDFPTLRITRSGNETVGPGQAVLAGSIEEG